MNPEIAAAIREDWYWRLLCAQWESVGRVAIQEKIISNQDTMLANLGRIEEIRRDDWCWRLFFAQWRAIWFVTTQATIIANQKVIIANLEKLATPIDDQIADITRQVDELDKVSDAIRIADARYISALEAALDESVPGWRGRVTREPGPSA